MALRVALPDRVLGKSDGVDIAVSLLWAGRCTEIARAELASGGWHVIRAEFAVPAGRPFVIRVDIGPRGSPAHDVVCFHSLTVTAGGLSRNLLGLASTPRVTLAGRPAPYRAEFTGGEVTIAGQRRTPWVLTHQPFGGQPCHVIVDFPSPPVFPGLANHALGAVARASSVAPGTTAAAACDGRYDLAAGSSWVDNTPDDFPDVLEIHFPRFRPPVVSNVVVLPNCGMMRAGAVVAAELWGLDADGWQKIGTLRRPRHGYFWWSIAPPRRLRALRLAVLDSAGELSRVLEVEAWGPQPRGAGFEPRLLLQASTPADVLVLVPRRRLQVTAVLWAPEYMPLDGHLVARLETRGGIALAEKRQRLRLAGGRKTELTVDLGTLPPGVYCLRVWVKHGGWVLGEQRTEVFVPAAKSAPQPAPVAVRPVDPRRGLISLTARMAPGAPAGRKRLELARRAGTDLVTAWTGLADLEPRPFCFNLTAFGPLVRRAEQWGRGVELLVMMNDGQVPEWLRGHEIRDSLGRPIARHAGRGEGGRTPSYCSPLFREHWQRLIAETVARFGSADAIKIWHFRPGDLDVFYHDIPRQRRIYDYSPFARAEFRRWLRDVRGLTLAQLSRRWAVQLKSWQQVEPPQPRFDVDVDLRPQWADFVDFKQWTIDHILDLTFSTVRRYDQRRPLALWALGGSGALDFVLRRCGRYRALASFNSIEHPYNAIWLDLARLNGAPIRTETGLVPPRPENFARSWFFALAGGANMYVWVGRVDPANPAWRVFCRSGEFFRALSGGEPASHDVAALFGYTYYRQKTFQWTVFARYMKPEPRLLLDAERRGLVELDWFSDYSPLADLSTYRLVIETNSPILPGQVIDSLANYVSRGGAVLLMCQSGKFRRADQTSREPLLRALGRPATAKPGHDGLERWRFGAGRVFRVPRPLHTSREMDAALQAVLDELHIPAPARVPGGIWVARIVKDGRPWALVYNTQNRPREVQVALRGMTARAVLWPLGDHRRPIRGRRAPDGMVIFRLRMRAYGLAAIGARP